MSALKEAINRMNDGDMPPRVMRNSSNHPVAVAAETIAREIVRTFVEANRTTIFRELAVNEKASGFISGSLTGIFVVLFSMLKDKPELREKITAEIAEFIPYAAANASSLTKTIDDCLHNEEGQ